KERTKQKTSFSIPLKEQPLKTSYFLDTPKRAARQNLTFYKKFPGSRGGRMLTNVDILPKILSLSGENLKKPYFLQKMPD
ncbi:MAG: hypothetical protein ACOYIG_06270, partial [Acetivibrionales bacterium]